MLSLRKVATRYVKGWFTLEMISSLPYDMIGNQPAISSRTIQLIALLRIFRLRRLSKVIDSSMTLTQSSGLAAFLKVLYILGAWSMPPLVETVLSLALAATEHINHSSCHCVAAVSRLW